MNEPPATWTIDDASEMYDVPRWGAGYFSVTPEGTLAVHPDRDPARSIDLKSLIERIEHRGLELPVLLRFNGIIRDRLREIHDCFSTAIESCDYKGQYRLVYPVKVNQQRDVIRKVVEYGREFGFGLEAGSKPELLAVVAMGDESMPIVCNGFKDDEFIEMALIAQKLGRTVLPIIEKYSELELILRHSEELGVRPQLGVRVKLASRGAGRWQSSGGYRSKFGLTVSEVLRLVDELESRGMSDCFKLLHFHLGSQITNIRQVKGAINEAVRVYVDLHRRGMGLEFLDVGGGLGVDYDGSQTNFESSINYTLQEYANDVVYQIQTVCDEANVPHPTIMSESGRAVAAYHSVLVFSTLGITSQGNSKDVPSSVPDDYEQPLHDLVMANNDLTARNVLETFHDAQQALDMAMNLFSTGYLPLEQRVLAENMFFAIAHRILKLTSEMEYVPDDLQGLPRMLADSYFCNFSLFQSMPDSWAIKQLFPIMPIHRLNERPGQQAVLCDITCDSDGKVDSFVDRRDTKRTLPLHSENGSPYYLGAFLIGAYQEILGDLHNLFGDTHAVHVHLGEDNAVEIESIVKGDTVREVLSYVQYNEDSLIDRLQSAIEAAVRKGRIDERESGQFLKIYEQRLAGYTYLTP
ncbi:Biosynthetic arginine decarboxylase [Rosistilla oblonga]|uniref:Biosynthetic arginine decarboxylase n=1 Tax=Rosistilla oblonga TaxID=2527990 RepID=A0A518IT84_9BACT|nr:biosynthetic arginine decarboxylase [Rosistilla oblonga]QDV12261.1 Biosynthetic arginine decarboxylase [Rosistilla oblonga]QDV56299.1 Biosynthetic arginine decarboxylase [Rosistilla oblonga]